MADFGEEEWTGMVCLEPCIVDDSAIRLDPGARHAMTVTLEVLASGSDQSPARPGQMREEPLPS